MMTVLSIILLYVAFRIKQFVCDFLLQTDWMALHKGHPGMEGYKALASHCLVHAAGTLLITAVFAPSLWWLAAVDFVVHGLIDRLKGMVTAQQRWTSADRWFWWTFGLDQEAHHITHLAYLAAIVLHTGIVGF